MSKLLLIYGGNSNDPITLGKDVLNSTWALTDEQGNTLFFSKHCARGPSRDLFGKDQLTLHGFVKAGQKLCGQYKENMKNIGDGVRIFRTEFKEQIEAGATITEEMTVIESIKKNPSRDNSYTISDAICHSTNGDQGNGSEGCQTCYYKEFHAGYAGEKSFEAQLKPGEVIDIIIQDTPEYSAELLQQYPVLNK